MKTTSEIWIAEDDRSLRWVMEKAISRDGGVVRSFESGDELLVALSSSLPEIIVSDIRMPGINGMELMKLIMGRDPSIPVILITGHGDIPLAVEAMKSGAFEFMPKPFSPEELLETVRRAQKHYVCGLEKASLEKSDSNHSLGSDASNVDSNESMDRDLAGRVDKFEKELICSALERNRGSVSRTMDELNIPRRTLNAKMQKHGISRAQFRN